MLYRSSYYNRSNPDGSEEGGSNTPHGGIEVEESEIMIAKHRNGPTGMVKLGFMRTYATFTELDRIHGE